MAKFPKPFLLISKPYGVTSRKFINEIQKEIKAKKIGHTGTLDPMATGLLFVAIDKGTKFIPYLPLDRKEYVIEITFGVLTDSWDITGRILKSETCSLEKEEVLSAIEDFRGEILQTPPIFSAKKYKGRESYKYARSGDMEVELEPAKVSIYGIDLILFSKSKAVLKVSCSKGTYMRSLAYNLGLKLGTYGALSAIARTGIGSFSVSSATTITKLKKGDYSKGFYDMKDVLSDIPRIVLKDKKKFITGIDYKDGSIFLMEHEGEIIGISKIKNGVLHPEVVIDENH